MQTARSERIAEPYLGGAAWGTGFSLPSENSCAMKREHRENTAQPSR